MTEMTEADLLTIIQSNMADAETHKESYMPGNVENNEYYHGEPNGFEVDGQSKITSTDVFDVIESDMPSQVRTFLGHQEIMEFKPNSNADDDVQEAKEKTKYVHWIIQNQDDAYTKVFSWLKNTELNNIAVLHYFWDERKEKNVKTYEGLDEDEITQIVDGLNNQKEQNKEFGFEIISQSEDKGIWDLKFEITRTIKGVVIESIPVDQMRISTAPKTKQTTPMIGHVEMVARGDLVAQGFDIDKLKAISPTARVNDTRMDSVRYAGNTVNTASNTHWTTEELQVSTLYIKVDFDGDGIPERRRIIVIGNEVFENDSFDHVAYAINSAYPMPDTLMGKSRAEVTKETQLMKTTVMRGVMDNIYAVNAPGVVVNDEETNLDDMLTRRPGDIIRTTADPLAAVGQLTIPYVGDKSLQVVQYLDSARAQSTGSLMANQSLDSDTLYKESARRFTGVQEAGAAKVELMTRSEAEIGWRDLMEGIAWLVSHYQTSRKEILVLGKPLTVNPALWWNDHKLAARVGLAAGDDEEILNNMSGIVNIQNQLKGQGSLLVDSQKEFNALDRITNAMGLERTDQYFNNPEEQNNLMLAQVEQIVQENQALKQQAAQNPLAEAETIKARSEESQKAGELKLKFVIEEQKAAQAKAELDFREKIEVLKLEKDYAKIEADNKIDIPNKGPNDGDLVFDPATGRINARA